MKVKWYGTASLLVEGGGTRLLIDPYLKSYNPALPPIDLAEAGTAAAIFITHPHFDHFSDIEAFTKEGGRSVYVSENGIGSAQKNGINTDCMLPLGANEFYRIGGLTVKTYQSRHCKFDVATVCGVLFSPHTYRHFSDGLALAGLARRFRIADDIYALEISDGEKRMLVLGSAGLDDGILYPKEADLLVFPYQGRSRMHKYMRYFLDVLRPKAVMIDHFDDAFPPYTREMRVDKFGPELARRLPSAQAIVPKEGEWIEF